MDFCTYYSGIEATVSPRRVRLVWSLDNLIEDKLKIRHFTLSFAIAMNHLLDKQTNTHTHTHTHRQRKMKIETTASNNDAASNIKKTKLLKNNCDVKAGL